MALPAGRYGVTKNQLLKIKKLPMNTIKLIEELTEKFDLLGTAAFKNSTSVVTSSSDLVESGAVYTALQGKADNSVIGTVEDGATTSQAYAVGSHAIRNGAFITWKNAKAQGETINDASDYTSGDVANSLIKEATFSGTTSDIGGLLISTSNTKHILSAEVQGYVIDIYKRSEGYGAIVKTIQTGERVVNTAVSGKYYYVEY